MPRPTTYLERPALREAREDWEAAPTAAIPALTYAMVAGEQWQYDFLGDSDYLEILHKITQSCPLGLDK